MSWQDDHLDYSDLARVEVWLASVKQLVADQHAVVEDMQRRPYDRELGPALHRERFGETSEGLRKLLDYASLPPLPEPEPSDPAGNGGAGPVH
jgi:hypothetical protein